MLAFSYRISVEYGGHAEHTGSSTRSRAMAETVRVAILDDYQKVAFKFADWSSIQDKLSIDVYTETLQDEEALVERLEPYTITSS